MIINTVGKTEGLKPQKCRPAGVYELFIIYNHPPIPSNHYTHTGQECNAMNVGLCYMLDQNIIPWKSGWGQIWNRSITLVNVTLSYTLYR